MIKKQYRDETLQELEEKLAASREELYFAQSSMFENRPRVRDCEATIKKLKAKIIQLKQDDEMLDACVSTDTVLSEGYLITLYDNDGTDIGEIIWGVVKIDQTHGWQEGDYACSTEIIEIDVENGVYTTKNTSYMCEAELEKLRLPLTSLLNLRDGIDPYSIRDAHENRYRIQILKDEDMQ